MFFLSDKFVNRVGCQHRPHRHVEQNRISAFGTQPLLRLCEVRVHLVAGNVVASINDAAPCSTETETARFITERLLVA